MLNSLGKHDLIVVIFLWNESKTRDMAKWSTFELKMFLNDTLESM